MVSTILTDGVRTLLDYGAVLEDVQARLDLVPIRRHAATSMVPVVDLSLTYRDDTEPKQLKLQVAPQVLEKLYETCAAFVSER